MIFLHGIGFYYYSTKSDGIFIEMQMISYSLIVLKHIQIT